MPEHRETIPPTPEQTATAQIASLREDFVLYHALRKNGCSFHVAGPEHFFWVDSDKYGIPSEDGKHPIVHRTGVTLPGGGELSPWAASDWFRKTKAKRDKFLKNGVRPATLVRYLVAEAGREYERRAIVTAPTSEAAEKEVVRQLAITADDKFRMVEIECIDDATVAETVEQQRDELPWAEDIELLADGSVPVGWHGCALDSHERERATEEREQARRAKGKEREALARELLSQPL